jgi:hypothetical protein
MQTVYRHVIVPAIRRGATIMDRAFNAGDTTGQRKQVRQQRQDREVT